VIVILLSVRFCQRRGVLLFGGTCVVLTVVSLLLTRSGSPYSGSINGAISIAAIAATTYLVLKIESAQAATYAARAQLAHIARVTTLGELTASIAHEVNQPLTAVVTNGNAGLRWLAAAPPNIAEAKQVIGRIVNEAKRASEIIGRVRHLARRAPAAPDWFDINETVLATIPPVQNQLKADRILLQTELGTDLPAVHCDQVQLQQVLLNLLVNAIESLAKVGYECRELRLATSRGRGGVVVAVRDTGAGLGAELDQVFNAFYTTKPDGLGMGLSIARSIIEAHGGRIWAEVNAPRGATIQFLLPVSPKRYSSVLEKQDVVESRPQSS